MRRRGRCRILVEIVGRWLDVALVPLWVPSPSRGQTRLVRAPAVVTNKVNANAEAMIRPKMFRDGGRHVDVVLGKVVGLVRRIAMRLRIQRRPMP